MSNKLTGLTRTRRDQLLEEYVRGIKEGDPHSDQPAHAMRVRLMVQLVVTELGINLLPEALARLTSHSNTLTRRLLDRVSSVPCGITLCCLRTTRPSGEETSRVRYASGSTQWQRGVFTDPHCGTAACRSVLSIACMLQVIHGRHDIVAPPKYGERLAARMGCPCIILEGAHFLTRERGPAINALLRHIIMPDAAKVRMTSPVDACGCALHVSAGKRRVCSTRHAPG